MSRDRMTEIALKLLKLGVSSPGVEQLLRYPLDEIERQLIYLPYRKDVKRPEAFIIEAVRKSYSAPKEFFYAANHIEAAGSSRSLDQHPQPPAGQPDALTPGHRAPSTSDPGASDLRLEPGKPPRDPLLPDPHESDGPP